jgi:RsiW-degrading membrane proteinase PrsW (M82 family)
MEQVAIFLAAVAPGLLMLAYGVAKTGIGWRNEALYTAVLAGAVGACVVTLVPGFEDVISVASTTPLVAAGVTAILSAAIPEEGVKFLILVGAIRRDVNVRRLQDIVALSLGVSIGAATFENLAYVVFDSDWRAVAIGRSLLSVPGHGINGLIMGALLTLARLRTHRRLAYVIAWAIPVAVHAAYDFPLLVLRDSYYPWFVAVWLAVLLLSAVLAIYWCNRGLLRAAEADRMAGRDTAPPAAGEHLVVGGFVMLIAAPLLGVLLFWLIAFPFVWAGVAISIFPVALGIDLIWTGIRRRKLPPMSAH